MLEKRSLSLSGHRTSIALEPEFWTVLESLAAAQNTTLLQLIVSIDTTRNPAQQLASTLRVYALGSIK